MNSQMTLLARGGVCGFPSGGVQVASLPYPSRCNIAPSATPVKPRPRSERKVRRSWRGEGMRQGDKETRRQGDLETWRLGDWET